MRDQAGRPFARVPLVARMIGASRLDVPTFQEVKGDPAATRQAVAVVAMAGMAIGFGAGPGLAIPLGFVLNWILWWGVWVFLLYVVGPGVFHSPREDSNWAQLARTTGYAQSPAVVLVFLSFVPGGLPPTPYFLVVSLVGIWWFAATSVAVRQSLHIRSAWWAMAAAATWFIPSILIEVGLL